jgi:hypothetical protein
MESVLTTSEAITRLVTKTRAVALPNGLKDKLDELFAQLSINARSEDT